MNMQYKTRTHQYFYMFLTFQKLYSLNQFNMPASKKDLKKQQQKKNVAAGIGDAQGRIASNQKADQVMAACTVCKQQIRMIKKNEQVEFVFWRLILETPFGVSEPHARHNSVEDNGECGG